MIIVSGEPPILIDIYQQAPVIVSVNPVPVVTITQVNPSVPSIVKPEIIEIHSDSTPDLVFTQEPGVGPPGPQGEQGIPGPIDPGLSEHLIDTTPHHVYDDQPSLVLIFENRLVG
jgi:hypothetical protein